MMTPLTNAELQTAETLTGQNKHVINECPSREFPVWEMALTTALAQLLELLPLGGEPPVPPRHHVAAKVIAGLLMTLGPDERVSAVAIALRALGPLPGEKPN